jgi:DNA mismatch repair protein MutS
LTPGMQRYWEIKRKVMDCILFYRFGDYYVLYFDDLTICNKLINLAVTPHLGCRNLGFHSSKKDKNVKILTDTGLKVAISEQMETK